MEYELIGRDGKTHDCFGSREEALDALRDEEAGEPGMTDGWMLQLYGDNGEELGNPERASDLLAEPTTSPAGGLSFVIVRGTENVGLFVPGAPAETSGKQASIRRGFRRPPSDAIRTRVLPSGETAAK
jgi:hypothetical protein